jgi:hypothetical protein
MNKGDLLNFIALLIPIAVLALYVWAYYKDYKEDKLKISYFLLEMW